MLKDVSGGRDQKRLFLFLDLLAVSETWLSFTLLAALISVPQRQLGSILQKIEGTIIFLDDDHYHFSHSLTREYLLDTQQPYCLEENDKVKAHQLLYRIAHFSFAILIAQQDLLIEAVEIPGKSAGQGMESDSIAIPEVIPRVIPGVIPHRMQERIPVAIADRFPTGGCFAPVDPLSGTPSAKLNRGGNCTHNFYEWPCRGLHDLDFSVVSLNSRDEVLSAAYHKIRAEQGTQVP